MLQTYVVCVALCLLCVLVLDLGSGVVPTSFVMAVAYILLVSAGAPVLTKLGRLAMGRRQIHSAITSAGQVIAIVATAGLCTFLWGQLIFSGLEKAKEHGAAIAASVSAFHDREKHWPEDEEVASMEKDVQDRTARIRYGVFAKGEPHFGTDYWQRVAGWFVSYKLDEGVPVVEVGRREVRSRWDFALGQWSDSHVKDK